MTEQKNTQKNTSAKEASGKKKLSQKQKCLIAIGIIVVAAAIGVLVYFLFFKDSGQKLTAANYKQIEDDMKANVQEGYFETYMNTEWTFPNGNMASTDAILGNSPSNSKPIRCEVRLTDSDEILFDSGVLPVGTKADEIKLSRDLEAGTYSAVCTIYLLDEKDGNYTDASSADFNITFIIEH